MSKKMPVTLVFAARGSGKTSLLRRAAENPEGRRILFLVNDETGMDGSLVTESAGDGLVTSLSNGCACHVMAGAFHDSFANLIDLGANFDGIMAELMGGEADPHPIMANFLVDGRLKDNFDIDGVVTIINGPDHQRQRQERTFSFDRQLTQADAVIINGFGGRMDEAARESARGLAQQLNSPAVVYEINDWSTDLILSQLWGLRNTSYERLALALSDDGTQQPHNDSHLVQVRLGGPGKEVWGAVDWARFMAFRMRLLTMSGPEQGEIITRTKFEVAVQGRDNRFFIDSSGSMNFDPKKGRPWGVEDPPKCRMFVEGHKNVVNAAEIKNGFMACLVGG